MVDDDSHHITATDNTVVGSSANDSECSSGTGLLQTMTATTNNSVSEDSLRRSGRSRALIDYTLPSLRTKLRQGDRHTFGEAVRKSRPGRTKPARRVPVEPPVVEPSVEPSVELHVPEAAG